MPKYDVVSLAINGADIRFGKCIANLMKPKPSADGGTPCSGNVTIFFNDAKEADAVTPHIGQRISLKFSTDSDTYECDADGHKNISFDGTPAFYILL